MEFTSAQLEYKESSELGEGPFWDERKNKLYWIDIIGGILYAWDPQKKVNKAYTIGEHIGAAALRENGGLIMVTQNGFAYYDFISQKIEPIVNPEAHIPGNRFNDGKCDPAGRFWAGSMAYNQAKGVAALYCLYPDGRIEEKLKNITISNGFAWNQTHDRFFYIDTPTLCIQSFDYDNQSGELSNRSTFREIAVNDGYPDGMCIDREDHLWIALYGGGKVIRVNPENGQTVFEVYLPVPKPTSCTFGGENFDELYITTCRDNMCKSELEKYPLSGSLFKAILKVKGWPAYRFKG